VAGWWWLALGSEIGYAAYALIAQPLQQQNGERSSLVSCLGRRLHRIATSSIDVAAPPKLPRRIEGG